MYIENYSCANYSSKMDNPNIEKANLIEEK